MVKHMTAASVIAARRETEIMKGTPYVPDLGLKIVAAALT
jgi:hypothetical protein